jgi:hypothetical protein
MKCAICGTETTHGYTVYQELAASKNSAINSSCSTGKAQQLLLRSGNKTYAQYNIPVCRRCVYLSQIRFNIAAAIVSGILGAVLLAILEQRLWGIIPIIFCAGNIIFGGVQLIKYIQDKPSENLAASSLNEHVNKGLSEQDKQPVFSFDSLKSQTEKLGKLAPVELAASASAKASVTAFSPKAPLESDRRTLPVCWVFACYDRERAQGLAILRADFYKDENVIKRVREHLHIPEIIDVKYVEASNWDAPGIHVVKDSFACNMDEIDGKVNAYLLRAGYCADKPKEAMKTTIPYPNAGVLLIVVNMLP